MECRFFLVVEGGDDFRFIPVDGAGRAVTSMLRDAGDVFVRFVGCSVGFVLTHPCAERDSRLAYVFSFLTTCARKHIDTFFIHFVMLCLV